MSPNAQPPLWREVLLLAGALLVAKALIWWIDPTLRTFMGDSASYLWSAFSREPAPDRSFTFSLLIRATALALHDLRVLGWLHSAIGVATSLLLFVSLRRHLGLGRVAAAAAAVALALEPGQLFYERMVMAESIGTFFLVAMVFFGLRYCRDGGRLGLVAMALCGTAVASLRLSSVPVVLGFALLPVLCRQWDRSTRTRLPRTLFDLGLALVLTVSLHHGYKSWFDHHSRFQDRSDYSHSTGKMRLGLLAPLVKPEHLVRAGLPADLIDRASPDPRDPRHRESQMWGPTGLFALIAEQVDDPETVSRKLAMYAFRDDPLGLLRLGASNLGGYFDQGIAMHRMYDDLGVRPMDEGMARIVREHFGWNTDGIATQPSPVWTYFKHSRWWWVAVLFALPALALALLWRGRRDGAAIALALAGLGLFASHALFSHIVSFRYLHPFTPFLLWTLGALLARPRPDAHPAAPDTPASSARAGRA